MKYSIIIPTYNSAKVIKRCLDSIVAQTFSDYEVLIMDGKSNDNTLDIVRSYNSDKIRFFSEPDKGIYDAMNKGIERSSGAWLLFLGSDDYLYNENVLRVVEKYLAEKYDIVYGEVESKLPEQNKGEWSLELLDANRCHQAIFYNRRFFGESLRYNLDYPVLADFDINLRWFLNKRYRHLYIPVVISYYSVDGYSSYTKDEAFYKNHGLNKLRYNHRVLTPLYKKRAARQYVNANQNNFIVKVVFTVYADIMFVLQKISCLFRNKEKTIK